MNPSIFGKKYEKIVHNITKKSTLNGNQFNTQNESQLGGCSNRNDIECNMNGIHDVIIEIKSNINSDYGQVSLKRKTDYNIWETNPNSKMSKNATNQINKYLETNTIFNNKIPNFMLNKKITKEEWREEKKEGNFKDHRFELEDENILNEILNKNDYIQIKNRGLYHITEDKCCLGTSQLKLKTECRIRCKVHETTPYIRGSITASIKPINTKNLKKSQYSLDNKDKLPPNLIYI